MNQIEQRLVASLVPYASNPRKNDAAVSRMMASIHEFGFKIPILCTSDGLVVDGHLRLKAAIHMNLTDVPVILCDEWTDAQVKAFRMMANRSATWAEWDEDLLSLEIKALQDSQYDLAQTGFNESELQSLLAEQEVAQAGERDLAEVRVFSVVFTRGEEAEVVQALTPFREQVERDGAVDWKGAALVAMCRAARTASGAPALRDHTSRSTAPRPLETDPPSIPRADNPRRSTR